MSLPTTEHTVHLVGSVRLPHEDADATKNPLTASEVFETVSAELSGRLKRIPDGETGCRWNFIAFQAMVFARCPWVLTDNARYQCGWDSLPERLQDTPERDRELELIPSGYKSFAFQSYQAFKKLKAQGAIAPGVRFQVCLPTPLNVPTFHIRQEYKARVFPLYEELMHQTITMIQMLIPASELSIQIDVVNEVFLIEDQRGMSDQIKALTKPFYEKPWFEPCIDEVVRFASLVNQDVELGLHLCYGDLHHKHVLDPLDLATVVKIVNTLQERLPRKIDFVHMPVLIDVTETAYLEPLKDLKIDQNCEVILGLVHANDSQGSRKRSELAKAVLGNDRPFAVATECGWGRTPVDHIPSLFEISRDLTS